MAFDYKKEYKEFYLPPKKPGIVDVPEMNYVAVRGKGNPNEPDGEYKTAMGLLYGIAFTIKMSYKGRSRDIFPTWCRLWKGSGIRTVPEQALTTPARMISAGSP